ncbi:MAG TPA: M48 family metalloprotease [Gemmatimonadales bacterium]
MSRADAGAPPVRRHFTEEQQRNRRLSRRFSVIALPAVLLAGIPLCIVASPIIFALVLVGASAWDLVAPLEPSQWAGLGRVAHALPELWNLIRGRPADVPWAALALLLVAPGMIVMLVAWPFVRHLSRVAGAGAILRLIPSREPGPGLAERQLRNVVGEMAVAAGVPVPAVRIIESEAVNVVAIGLTTADATILASEGFLRTLTRDERQAMVGHLIASVGNGDLEIAAVVLSIVETWALLATLLESVVYPEKRALVRDFARASARSVTGKVTPDEARAVVNRLIAGEPPDPMTVAENFQPHNLGGVLVGLFVLIPVLATIGLASIAARQAASLFTVIGFGPWIAAMWRSRRRLADATAVQLSRNPTALAAAVARMAESDVEIVEAWPVYFLFPAWVPISGANAERARGAAEIVGMRLDPEPRLEELARLGGVVDGGRPALTMRERLRRDLGSPSEVAKALGWGVVAVALVALLLAGTAALTTWLLGLLWSLLQALGAGPPPPS